MFHAHVEHIRVKYHFITDLLDKEDMEFEKIKGSENPTNMMIKFVVIEKLRLHHVLVGLRY